MAMRIEVTERPVELNEWKDRDGNVRISNRQWAVLHVDGLPTAFQFGADVPLPPGPAELSPRSFNVVNGRLQLTRAELVSLVPAKPAAPAAPAAPAVSK